MNALARATASALRRSSYLQVLLQQSSRQLSVRQVSLRQQQQQSGKETPLRCDFIEDNLKLQVQTGDTQTVVEAEPCPTGREGRVVRVEHGSASSCALCRLNLKGLSYTDVKILSQFVKKNGSIVSYHESGVCSRQYNKVMRLIKQAWRCNLMDRPADYLVPGPWHDLNTYLEPDRKRDYPMKVVKKGLFTGHSGRRA